MTQGKNLRTTKKMSREEREKLEAEMYKREEELRRELNMQYLKPISNEIKKQIGEYRELEQLEAELLGSKNIKRKNMTVSFSLYIPLGRAKRKDDSIKTDRQGVKYIKFRDTFTETLPMPIAFHFKPKHNNYFFTTLDAKMKPVDWRTEDFDMMKNHAEVENYIMYFVGLVIQYAKNNDFFAQVANYVMHGYSFQGLEFHHFAEEPEYQNIKPDYLKMKLKLGDTPKTIFSEYTTYDINTKATDFSNLLVAKHNDYIKQNYRPNSCVLTATINKLYDAFDAVKTDGKRYYQQLTYPRLCHLLGIEDKPTDNELTVEELVENFVKKFNFIAFYAYSPSMELIYHHESKSKGRKVDLRVMIKDGHMYELNANLDSLAQKNSINYDDDERRTLTVSNKYNILYNSKSFDEVREKTIKFCETENDILNTIKKIGKTKLKNLKIITPTKMTDLLFTLMKAQYTPNVRYSSFLTNILMKIGKLNVNIEACNVDNNYGYGMTFCNVDEYYNFHEANIKFYLSIVQEKLISYSHDSVLNIEKEYSINAVCGKFSNKYEGLYSGLDENCAYGVCLQKIKQVPVFSVFDIYKKYDDHVIEDYTYYIVKIHDARREDSILFNKEISRVFGFVLKCDKNIKYEVLYYRRPSKIENVDFASAVDTLFKNKQITYDDKKNIVCITTGLLEKKKNTAYLAKIFENFNEAQCYALKYTGDVKSLHVFENKEVEEYDEAEKCAVTTMSSKITNSIHLAKIEKSERLINGFTPIKDMIYYIQRMKLFELYNKLDELGVKVFGCKTDCLFYHPENSHIIEANFPLEERTLNKYKIETNKTLNETVLKLEKNALIDFPCFDKPNIKTFKDEYDMNTISEYYKSNKSLLIKAKYPGSGKSYSVYKTYEKKVLTILPENTLCRVIKKKGFDSITFNKLFSLTLGDIEHKHIKEYDVSDYDVLFFDEVAKYEPKRLARIYEFMKKHSDKTIICAGDCKQIRPISYTGTQEYLDQCFNIMFNNQVFFTEIKRCKTEDDKKIMMMLYSDIFESNITDIKYLCERYGIRTETNINNVKTLDNIAYFNSKCKKVSEHVHFNVLKSKTNYHSGLLIICKKYYRDMTKNISLQVNNSYVFKQFLGKNAKIYDDIDNVHYVVPKENITENFIYPYCRTIDSQQGATIDNEITLFNLDSPLIDKERLWVALTRASELKNITVFLEPVRSIENFKTSIHNKYFSHKVKGYKEQDSVAKRAYDEKDFVDVEWIQEQIDINSCSCSHCGNVMDMEIIDGRVESNITVDRMDNSIAHIKTNCKLACLLCNVSKRDLE